MPAHTQTWRAEDKHMDRQTSADNTESFLLCQTLSCFTAGPRIHTGLFLSCLRQCQHTHKHGKPKTNTRTADNTALGFQAPWVFLSTGAIIYPSPLSWKCSPLVKGSWTSPQMLYPMSESPSGKREGLQDTAIGKKGKFITDSSQGPLPHPAQWCRSESPEPKLLHKFIGWAHAIGLSELVTSLQSNFIGQNFHAGGTFLGVSTPFLIS